MNRSIPGEANALQQTSSSSYLVYLFIVSAAFIVFLPYLSPMGGKLLRSGKKVDVVGRVNSDTFKKISFSKYTSLPSDAVMKKAYYSESKCEALEGLVMDLQRAIQTEREKTFNLENEVRVLQMSEGFLKERIQKLEDDNSQSRKDLYGSYTSTSDDYGMRYTAQTGGRRENLDVLVHDLLRMVNTEQDRTTALEVQVRSLQRSEATLKDRIEKLEEKFALYMADCRQANLCDIENERRDNTKF